MINLALVGAAHIHTPGFIKRIKDRSSEFAVKAVWDHDAGRAQKAAGELNAQVVEDPKAIWSDREIPAVVICSETNRHQDLVAPAARAKKHMFVEKPLGMGGKDAYAMARAIDKAGVLFQTGYFMRGNPMHRFLREQVQRGSFGRISRVRASNCHAGSLKGFFDGEYRWMADLEQAGCGAFGDLGTHVLDILMWLFGDIERVAADINVVTGRYGQCDETGEGLIQFDSGPIGTLAAGWVDVADPSKLLISGTEGHAHVVNGQLFFKSNHVEGADGEQPWTDLPDAWPHAFELFLDAVAGKQDVPLVKPQEAAARSAVMEAFYRAAQTRRWVVPKGVGKE